VALRTDLISWKSVYCFRSY